MGIRKQSNTVRNPNIKEKDEHLTDADLENISGGRKEVRADADITARRAIDKDTTRATRDISTRDYRPTRYRS
ncbi:Uncharacterised protein [Legionella busanensis]|uniref:Uncharacterized protein n=1 Tax=Legionella busanensis TaxID=190655 RepID=A0A378JLL1_9GAMM|nr:hypothetical protein [Legionella busanensis]STX51099.1 Uncharacterised protein [Legionella busanensis]